MTVPAGSRPGATSPAPSAAGAAPRSRRHRIRRVALVIVAVAVLVGGGAVGSTMAYAAVPPVGGDDAVGRMEALIVDPSRTDEEDATRPRTIRLVAWYPALPATGSPAGYLPGLDAVREGLVSSGEVSAVEAAALALVRANAREGAAPRPGATFPVVLLSPGNLTNVGFYASLAEDLASRGYAVIGIDHPYQVAAVDLGDRVAVYRQEAPGQPIGEAIAAKVDTRVADLRFVLDALGRSAAGLASLDGRLDLTRIAAGGHSNGGVAAAETCAVDARVQACFNIDGQHAGGPFGTRPGAPAPIVPFLYLTKEVDQAPATAARFAAATVDTYRVVLEGADHGMFADGARFRPRLLPVDGPGDRVLLATRAYVGAFLDRTLGGTAVDLARVTSPYPATVLAHEP